MNTAATSLFVDRERELRELHDAFGEVAAGSSRILVVEGEAGVGKTTVMERFLSEIPAIRLLRADGDETESRVPFAMADQLLRAGGAGSDVLRAGQHVAVGGELLELICSTPEGVPCVVFIDDAHLVDTESLRALLFCARRLAGCRALVTLAVRGSADDTLSEGWRRLADGPNGGRLRVGPFAPEHVLALGNAFGVVMTQEAATRVWEHTNGNPLHIHAVLEELPADSHWQHEHRQLPVPRSYAQLVRQRLHRCEADVVRLIEAAAVLGVRAPLHTVSVVADLEHPLDTLDAAISSGLVHLDERERGALIEFSHPLTRAAVYEALPNARRSAFNLHAAQLVDEPGAALRHRVEAATLVDDGLLADLESHAQAEMARGAWSSAVSSLIAASRLSWLPADRERLALEAIEATMYSGDGAAARRLAASAEFAEGPRRDSVLAYLAIFAGDVAAAQQLLTRAWDRRAMVDDDRLSATIAQRSAFLATSRLRGHEAIEWVERASALAPDDPATGLLVAPSLALGMSFTRRPDQAHAALDRWLDDPSTRPRAAGFVLLALKGFLLLADGDVPAARAAFETSLTQSLERGLLVVAAMSLAGMTRVDYVAGAWDAAVVCAERAIALAVESEDRWVIGQAHWCASLVPSARGEWEVAASHVRAIAEQQPTFERHIAVMAIATAGLAAARERPAEVLSALEPLDQMGLSDGVGDQTFLPWQHLRAHALVDHSLLEAAGPCISAAAALARARANPLLEARLMHARGKLEFARQDLMRATASLREARARIEPLGMPYEQALIELTEGQVLRRAGERRAAAALFVASHERMARLGARPAMQRCEQELAACGLTPTARKARDSTALTPQELAVTRLVVSGMTNREVSESLMLSTKTVEFHLSNIYTKVGVRTRAELRARARANELTI